MYITIHVAVSSMRRVSYCISMAMMLGNEENKQKRPVSFFRLTKIKRKCPMGKNTKAITAEL